MAGLLTSLSRFGVIWPLPVRFPGRAIRAALDALGGVGVDRLAVTQILVPRFGFLGSGGLVELARARRVGRCPGHGGLLTGLPLSARLQRDATAAGQMGSLRCFCGPPRISRYERGHDRRRTGYLVCGHVGHAPRRGRADAHGPDPHPSIHRHRYPALQALRHRLHHQPNHRLRCPHRVASSGSTCW